MKKRKKTKSNKKKSNKNITINISNRWMYTILIFTVLILGFVIVNASRDSSRRPHHYASDIKLIIDGNSYSLQEAIDTGLIGKENWLSNENGIHYEGGKVGIGEPFPERVLDVNGEISADSLSIDGRPIYFKNNKLCYLTYETVHCSTDTVNCEKPPKEFYVAPGINGMWNCDPNPSMPGIYPSPFFSACNEYCATNPETWTISKWVSYGFPEGVAVTDEELRNIIGTPQSPCRGDDTSCEGGTLSKWAHGSYVSCYNGNLLCKCDSPTPYKKEVKTVYGGVERCLQ